MRVVIKAMSPFRHGSWRRRMTPWFSGGSIAGAVLGTVRSVWKNCVPPRSLVFFSRTISFERRGRSTGFLHGRSNRSSRHFRSARRCREPRHRRSRKTRGETPATRLKARENWHGSLSPVAAGLEHHNVPKPPSSDAFFTLGADRLPVRRSRGRIANPVSTGGASARVRSRSGPRSSGVESTSRSGSGPRDSCPQDAAGMRRVFRGYEPSARGQ